MKCNPCEEVLAQLPSRVSGRLKSCPESGQGVNPWLFNTALALTHYLEDAQISHLLEAYVSCPGREREIERAVSNARKLADGEISQFRRKSWPAAELKTAHDVVVGCTVSLEKLRSLSPMAISDKSPKSEGIIDCLFPGNPLLCCAREKNLFRTKPRESWRGKESLLQFIVPSVMKTRVGKTQQGKESTRCLDNTGDRQFLVVEFDIGDVGKWEAYVRDWQSKGISTFDAQSSLLVHLATQGVPRLRFVMAVHSGKKSLHGWFDCAGMREDQTRGFMERAVRLGADPATWTKCQLVRFPGGTREDGTRQQVEYYNPPEKGVA